MDSSMVESVFDDTAESDVFVPAPIIKAKPKAKAAPKAAPKKAEAAPKAASKKESQTTLTLKAKPAASKKRPKPDTEDESEDSGPKIGSQHDDSLLSVTPPSTKKQKKAPAPKKSGGKPFQELENESMGLDGANEPASKKGASSSDAYQKLTQLEHIIKRPDTYVGSVERSEKLMWVYNTQMDSMEMREVSFVPGLYKIFDEILVNAADNKQRDKNMDTIKVTVNRESGQISVMNNGRGIPIEIHEKEKIYIPEMIFGHLLTSSNYDDDQQKVTGGRNGYGAKLCNIFSTEFILETADSKSKKKYKQVWTGNMSHMGKATISPNKGDDFTNITFTPDFKKFKMDGIDDDFEALVKRRVYDLAGTSKGVKVFLNGEKIKVNSFKKYMEMYTKAIKRERGDEAVNDTSDIITDNPDVRWEIGFAVSDGTFQQVSFVNSIATTSGGTHVNFIADQICTKLLDIVKRRNKGGAALKISQIRNHIFLFVNCLIVNPAFTSQTKEQLTTKHGQFGSKCTVSDDFLKKIAKTEVVNNILHFAQQKADQILKKSDGNRRSRMDNPKLTDANKAGTKDGYKCTLILTEGDSAIGMAIAGRSVVSADLFGAFPLRGKLLNVRDASLDQISKNAEIQNIKNFLGLKHKVEYTDCKSLRYGHLMIMTDQDHDGSHIKGLLINFLQVSFPSLLKIPGFLIEFITPIVKVYKGDPKNPTKSQSFFTMPEYEAWKEEHKNERNWEHKYYKGLGTSGAEDAEVYFRDLDKHLKEFHIMQDAEAELIERAFSKKKADERKEWLRQFKPGTYLDMSSKEITYTDFVNKELILFSMADNLRSIPSVVDGLKPGQRKVLFTCFKRNVRKDIKVVELAGSVSGLTAYPHGETSLQQTIVGLAQTFVGSNNVNCLEPSGNFGTRIQGGNDCASARYIYTRLSPFARRIFHQSDEPLLTYHTDDDKRIEPHMYVPVVPMILINGADGIGTGWSSSIPNYNPEDIVKNLRLMMDGEPIETMVPWFRDFKGSVTPMGQDRYKFSGIIKQTSDTELEVTELPIRMWTQDFKEKIVEIIKAEKVPSFIKDYDDYNTHKDVHFIIRMEEKHMKIALETGLEEKFKLTKSIATSNLVAFDAEGRITKYASVEDILKEYYGVRIKLYEKRKAYQLSEMQKDLEKLSNQARFIQMIIDGKLVVSKKKKKDLVSELKQKGFKAFSKVVDATKDGEFEPALENEEETEEDVETGASAYDYLLGMAIWSLTKERVERLLKQVGDKELEIDTLIKLSKEDLWKRDLDDFINEWRYQLDDEAKRQKKAANLGRRASTKLNIGGAKAPAPRKRKAQGDDDWDEPKPKKPTATKHIQPKIGMLSHLSPPAKLKQTTISKALTHQTASTAESSETKPVNKDSEDAWRTLDGAVNSGSEAAEVPKLKKGKTAAASKKPAPKKKTSSDDEEADEEIVRPAASRKPRAAAKKIESDDEEADEEIIGPAPSRKPRAAASKPISYGTLSASDDDNGDNLLFDVGKMVKGIGNVAADTSTNARPLFSASMSRPSSSAGLPSKKSLSSKAPLDFDADDTDYSKLAPPPTTKKGPVVTAKTTVLSDDDTLDSVNSFAVASLPPPKVSKKAAVKPAVKGSATAVAAPKPKVPAKTKVVAAEPKKSVLSPAAKAYAAKQSRRRDEVDEAAEEILDDDDDDGEDEEVVQRRPARRAAAAVAVGKAAKALVVESGSEVGDEEESESESEGFEEDEDSY